ncbi:MAG: DUF4143 domain-containing protein [Propionibacteriaceae bacterium]|jgi:predicted AAA+ superfamily ATPase|nr:DUF4143 domain-containing protein [Propionibacteriaceae bacterium]
MNYRTRVIDTELAALVAGVPAVVIVGAKAVGKTESARLVAGSMIDLTDDDQLQVLRADRGAGLKNAAAPVLIDEWQLDAPTWEVMRRSVDADPSPGRFILTGSANPQTVRVHSGAGRVVRIRMRPLSLAERGISQPTVSFAELWEGKATIAGVSPLSLADYAQEIVGSGFPAIRFGSEALRGRLLSSYVESVVEHELPALGTTLRKPASLRAWLRAFSAAVGTTASYTAIADAVPEGERASRVTISGYRDALEQLWLLDQIPAYPLGHNRLSELGKIPKHHLVDPALAASCLGITVASLLDNSANKYARQLREGPMLGHLFESLAALCVRVYAQASGLDVSHIRTKHGEHEVDLVAHAPDGRLIAFEVKLGAVASDNDVRHLVWLKKQLGSDVVDTVVLTTGEHAYRRSDGIAVVPLALLGS